MSLYYFVKIVFVGSLAGFSEPERVYLDPMPIEECRQLDETYMDTMADDGSQMTIYTCVPVEK